MIAQALWNTVLGIFSFFFMGYFPKFVTLVNKAGNKLSGLQILVSGDLWRLDGIFWAWAIPLSAVTVSCAMVWKCIEISCENRRYDRMIDGRSLIAKARRLEDVA